MIKFACYFCGEKNFIDSLAIISFEHKEDPEDLILENIITFCNGHISFKEHIEDWIEQWRAEELDFEDVMHNLEQLKNQVRLKS